MVVPVGRVERMGECADDASAVCRNGASSKADERIPGSDDTRRVDKCSEDQQQEGVCGDGKRIVATIDDE